ncbi:single-stranded DNA-binding protein [Mycoplasmopsis arginini]|nr:single-stranded DNA-binding protein [Chlamydia trachomatis]SGA02410.1 single-stranded DNA-binding protein [Chlamydia abortus]SGA04784.1 single-stranded DNA-binding protein [Mycoplasmopsis arginini]CRH46754.1 single-stranded DNA-binding protein [Chlamydia trachomatis]CRH55617.1 single-stranded DNA-binding protein [Chlamydia trachomatis]
MDKGSLMLIEGTFQSSKTTDQNGQTVNNYVISADRIQSLETKEVSESRRKNNLKEFSISNEENKTTASSSESQSENEETEAAYDGLS